ncbi:hypothetical protein [Runella slithyformis]|uniref:Uncharacterized protein n=1 Tax=Runella slithyformis (strain ATCC 29530 / DSM 19594 / LMG 11500 / NCIMB 11436 / LSU 4) TaxID=761193 RepID=A0A7U3ZME4_RUNSL|nr:hypothetical protein [Runella slithyformis]AEI49906.1 hypothetical protein Runsl_3545 [Runella slithyformis DSM 19594]
MNTPPLNEKPLFWVSAAIVSYFGFVYLNHYFFRLNVVLLDVFQEILLFPLMALQLVLLFFSLQHLIAAKFSFKSYSFPTFCMLLISSILTWGSFFAG